MARKIEQQVRLGRHARGLAMLHEAGQPRHQHMNSIAPIAHVERRARSAKGRLFDEENAPVTRAPRHQVLRPLEDEVPPEMRKAHQIFG